MLATGLLLHWGNVMVMAFVGMATDVVDTLQAVSLTPVQTITSMIGLLTLTSLLVMLTLAGAGVALPLSLLWVWLIAGAFVWAWG